jgi:hypothetical protein
VSISGAGRWLRIRLWRNGVLAEDAWIDNSTDEPDEILETAIGRITELTLSEPDELWTAELYDSSAPAGQNVIELIRPTHEPESG